MLSPILRHWGLELLFDETQSPELRRETLFRQTVPVRLPGRFVLGHDGACMLHARGLAAECAIGAGRVLAIADATLLDGSFGETAGNSAALAVLIRHLRR